MDLKYCSCAWLSLCIIPSGTELRDRIFYYYFFIVMGKVVVRTIHLIDCTVAMLGPEKDHHKLLYLSQMPLVSKRQVARVDFDKKKY